MTREEKGEGKVTLDDLAQMVAGGFGEIRQEMEKRFDKVDVRFSEVEDRLLTLEKNDVEDMRRFDSFERKLDGLQYSLDATVPRDEFNTLVVRVDRLEHVA